jgi:hypothetical protein
LAALPLTAGPRLPGCHTGRAAADAVRLFTSLACLPDGWSTLTNTVYRKGAQIVTQNTSANAALPASRMPTTTLPCQRRSSGPVSSFIGLQTQKSSTERALTEVEARRPKYTIHLIVNLSKVTTISSPDWSPYLRKRPWLDPWALQDFLAVIPDHCAFRFSHGDRNAHRDPGVCPRPSLGSIGTGDPARTQVGLDRAWCGTAVRAGARWLWTRLAPDPLA